jgi:hypothetical protein
VVRVEYLAHSIAVIISFWQIVISVIRYQERFQTKFLGDQVGLEVTVFSATHRNNAIIVGSAGSPDLFYQLLELVPALLPEFRLQLSERFKRAAA